MPVRIVALSGPSGSGKTTIIKAFLTGDLRHLLTLIPSTTTRPQRKDDLSGEYEYLSELEFMLIKRLNRFLWWVKIGNAWYGTRKEAVEAFLLGPGKIGLMILTPEKASQLKAYVKTNHPNCSVYSIYILSPGEKVLRERMCQQGRSEEEIRQRLRNDAPWDAVTKQLGVTDEFIENSLNDGGVSAAIHIANRILAFSLDLPR